MPTVAICTAWLNHPELEADYFAAVEAAQPDQLVIVDDGSDVSLPYAAYRLETQTGFCSANNAGLVMVETDYVLLLNNDIKMKRPDWFQDIRDGVEKNVLLGPLRFDPHGHVDGQPYPYVDGWCAAIHMDDLRRIGLLDERYDKAGPAYFSDNILSLRARAKGMTLRDLRPGLHHKGGQTGGQDQPVFQAALKANGELFASDVRELVGAPA